MSKENKVLAAPKKTGKAKDKEQAINFETALANLQAVVARMETQQQSLDASIADYEEGMRLSAICQQHLDTAQLKVETLVKTKSGTHFETFESEA